MEEDYDEPRCVHGLTLHSCGECRERRATVLNLDTLRAQLAAAVERAEQAERLADVRLNMISGMLARIHRDGGQHEAAIGTDASYDEADFVVANLHSESDGLRSDNARLRELLGAVRWSEYDGPQLMDVRGVNWWDAREAILAYAAKGGA